MKKRSTDSASPQRTTRSYAQRVGTPIGVAPMSRRPHVGVRSADVFFYHVNTLTPPATIPIGVLYSCTQHTEEDWADETYERCRVCECLFERGSMWSELICKVCFDAENMSNRHNWIQLDAHSIKLFGFSDIVTRNNPSRGSEEFASVTAIVRRHSVSFGLYNTGELAGAH